MDTSGTTTRQKKAFQGLEAYRDTNNRWEDTLESSGANSEGESTSTEVGSNAVDIGSTFFTPPQLQTSAHLIATTLLISLFGQRHPPIVMTPWTTTDVVFLMGTSNVVPPMVTTEGMPS